jgi:squalene/oxidosqualene cyclase-like protein
MFLLPLYVATCHGTGVEHDARTRSEMARYLRGTQGADGGWGLHYEGHSHVFTTALCYVALRLLGAAPGAPNLERARSWLHAQGGPVAAAAWGKFALALLGLYEYEGLNPVPPEAWLLPQRLPVHPSRLWCHARMVYLPMSYLYGNRVKAPLDATLAALRDELYPTPYAEIDWPAQRNRVAQSDSYVPHSPLLDRVNTALHAYERHAARPLRKRALDEVLRQVGFEDRNTDYVCLGPVNKLYHLWVWHHARPGGEEFRRHVERLPEYLYQAGDGIKMQGYHSSELWDTTFAVQALLASGQGETRRATLERAARFIAVAQVPNDVPHRAEGYRDPTVGGWGFSDATNGWVVSDCTAQGILASIELEAHVSRPLPLERLEQAVDLLLWMQTPDGGWASYEPPRGPAWLEKLNPSDCFGDIMIDYSYVECTASSIEALAAFQARHPGARDAKIRGAIERGRDYLLARQRPDGSFEGSWGVCFTYATRFGIEGLRAAGLPTEHEAIRRAAWFLRSHQLADGGWGELPESNRRREYVSTADGQAVQTAWAVLALCAAGEADSHTAQKGVYFLLRTQLPRGDWAHGPISGMFNKTCAIHYDNYARYFPLWALARATRRAS